MSANPTEPDPADASIYPIKDVKVIPDGFLTYSPEMKNDTDLKIVIDNGSFQCRVGWSRDPSPSLVYKNITGRTRKDKGKESELQVGNDVLNIEAVRFNLKTPFERNIVTQYETQEILLDYGFSHLGIDTEDGIRHPIVMTEPLGNPNICRSHMNELLFEGYSVPKVSYGIDSLFSLHHNVGTASSSWTGIIVSLGFHTIHFVTLVDGKVDSRGVRRLNIGGLHISNYFQRALQLKYPGHVNNITLSRAEEMLQDHCYVANDFKSALARWSSQDYYRQNVHKMQLPYVPAPKPPPTDPEVLRQRRQELAKRLVEINARKREEKLQEDESNLKVLLSARNLYEQGYDDKVKRILSKIKMSVTSQNELEQLITKTKARIEKAKQAMAKKSMGEVPVIEPVEQPEAKRRREDMDDNERKEFDLWIEDIKNKRQELLDRRAARKQRREQLAKRRTAASQERMRIISQLAKNSKKDDTFGMNDDDWDVYKKINKDVGDSDSEEEQERLVQYEAVLKEHDPKFGRDEEEEIPHDSIEWYQLHLATERIKMPEVLFQPSIIGHDQAGISETIEFILTRFPPDLQQRLIDNVFVTGSMSVFPGLKERLERDIMSFRPFQSSFGVTLASNPSLDPWFGARTFAANPKNDDKFVSREDYVEKGTEYLIEHYASNSYCQTPSIPEPSGEM